MPSFLGTSYGCPNGASLFGPDSDPKTSDRVSVTELPTTMAPGQAHHSNEADALCSADDEDDDGDGDGWPATLVSTINTIGQQHWPPPLVSITGRQH